MTSQKQLKLFMVSQSISFFASSLIFPFYILFLKNVGSSFTTFGFSYGLFGLSSAIIYPLLGKMSMHIENRNFMLIHCFGMAIMLLCFPHITGVGQVYCTQVILGILGAIQKYGEKMLLVEYSDEESRGKNFGDYHFWTALFSSIAVMSAGVLADFFTIDAIFYGSSVAYFVSGVLFMYKKL